MHVEAFWLVYQNRMLAELWDDSIQPVPVLPVQPRLASRTGSRDTLLPDAFGASDVRDGATAEFGASSPRATGAKPTAPNAWATFFANRSSSGDPITRHKLGHCNG